FSDCCGQCTREPFGALCVVSERDNPTFGDRARRQVSVDVAGVIDEYPTAFIDECRAAFIDEYPAGERAGHRAALRGDPLSVDAHAAGAVRDSARARFQVDYGGF